MLSEVIGFIFHYDRINFCSYRNSLFPDLQVHTFQRNALFVLLITKKTWEGARAPFPRLQNPPTLLAYANFLNFGSPAFVSLPSCLSLAEKCYSYKLIPSAKRHVTPIKIKTKPPLHLVFVENQDHYWLKFLPKGTAISFHLNYTSTDFAKGTWTLWIRQQNNKPPWGKGDPIQEEFSPQAAVLPN